MKVAKEGIAFKKTRGKAKRRPSTKVVKSHWSDGLDPRVVEAVEQMHIPQVWTRIDVISPTEVIIRNHPIR